MANYNRCTSVFYQLTTRQVKSSQFVMRYLYEVTICDLILPNIKNINLLQLVKTYYDRYN